MKKKIILLTLLVLFPVSSKASECSYAEQARLRNIASNVTTSYEYVENDGNVTFNVILTNITNEIYIQDYIDRNNNKNYYYNGTNEIKITGYTPGTNIRYLIYPTKGNCTNSYLANKYVNLPYYNKYYKDSLCEGKTYSICNKWAKVTYTYDEFAKKINELDKNDEVIEENIKEEKNIFDIISKFIFDYYIFIIAGGVVIVVITSIIKKKKTRFNF